MFLDEARLAVKLEHPNIVQTFEAGERSGLYYLLMAFLDGQPLNRGRQASAQERFPLALHALVLLRALRGLSYAHELADLDGKPPKIVHRDMRPQNVFVTYDGRVKVVDFGIAKATTSRERTETGVFNPSLPKALVAICERALKWNRDERFASSAAMADELEAYLKGLEQPPASSARFTKTARVESSSTCASRI